MVGACGTGWGDGRHANIVKAYLVGSAITAGARAHDDEWASTFAMLAAWVTISMPVGIFHPKVDSPCSDEVLSWYSRASELGHKPGAIEAARLFMRRYAGELAETRFGDCGPPHPGLPSPGNPSDAMHARQMLQGLISGSDLELRNEAKELSEMLSIMEEDVRFSGGAGSQNAKIGWTTIAAAFAAVVIGAYLVAKVRNRDAPPEVLVRRRRNRDGRGGSRSRAAQNSNRARVPVPPTHHPATPHGGKSCRMFMRS